MDSAAVHRIAGFLSLGRGNGSHPAAVGRQSSLGRGRSCLAACRNARFADQSHVVFYARPRKQRRSATSSPRGFAGKFEMATVDDESVQEVIRQLEELQLKAKAKKKELKCKKEKEKKQSAMAAGPAMKKRKKESSSSSSESSDSSGGECGSSRFDMSLLREELRAAASPRSIIDAVASEASLEQVNGGKCVLAPPVCARVEVCTGGKCRKAGSQQVLAAFQAKISSSSSPSLSSATSCKCMGMCGQGPNVRIQGAGDGAPLAFNHVGVEDVDPLLQQAGFPAVVAVTRMQSARY
ncbi:diacylglycerol O-acyltransferase 3, cytosolic [Selaginella moellendorffii]|uniref:diacylglycerol O-acyltransferase 3, cytosolic n=1 Tax=Selaginella moellendorffii TaxID=88036 RepID=UPI000D1C6FCC|nr:diacylglycerol O-acyltransferase 3, cytosolic [Selaginella moellendorffii]|eukprot:XP_024525163.1 diacylglycerol O-acyltransferase 3, cytosolic [Selaginella moellendorffii]